MLEDLEQNIEVSHTETNEHEFLGASVINAMGDVFFQIADQTKGDTETILAEKNANITAIWVYMYTPQVPGLEPQIHIKSLVAMPIKTEPEHKISSYEVTSVSFGQSPKIDAKPIGNINCRIYLHQFIWNHNSSSIPDMKSNYDDKWLSGEIEIRNERDVIAEIKKIVASIDNDDMIKTLNPIKQTA